MKKRKDGRYCLKKTINGKAVFIYGNTEREVYKKLDELENKNFEKAKTYGDYASAWANLKKEQVGFRTFKTYESALERLSPVFETPMEKLACIDIQRIINRTHNEGLSKSILLKVKSVNSMVIDYAIGEGERILNFSDSLTIPKNAKQEIREALTEKEISVVEESWNVKYGLYAYFLLYTGLRRGEALALQWKDIDFKSKEIHVTKAAEFKVNAPTIKETKTKNSVRIVPLLDCLAEKLVPGKPDEYVFGGVKPYTSTMSNKRWKAYQRASGLTVTQHQLRHTYATMLCKVNVSVKDAQKLLGHADFKTTMNIYTHFQNSAVKNAQNALNNYLSSHKSSQQPHKACK